MFKWLKRLFTNLDDKVKEFKRQKENHEIPQIRIYGRGVVEIPDTKHNRIHFAKKAKKFKEALDRASNS